MKARIVLASLIVLFLLAACVSFPAAHPAPMLPAPTAAPATDVTDGWQTYTNPLGFSIRYPAGWNQSELPQQTGDTIHTVMLQGAEGAVDLHWGVGFGGACPQGYTTVKVAEGELPACYSKNADGTEVWTQINKELADTSFSAEARTNNADPASHDLILEVLSTLSFPSPQQSAAELTARMLTAPNALVGPSPSSFNWSPVGTELAYVDAQGDEDVLWLYDAATGDKKVLLDPAQSPGNIDVTSAQWSPSGDKMLLTGDEALWLLEVSTGKLTSVVENAGSVTGQMFTPDGKAISYVQDNDLYVLTLADGKVQRLTTDGGETVFNGGLDWVYTEELATRAAQPGYAWSPDGVWMIYLRLDESAVHKDPVTDYRPCPSDRQLYPLSYSGHTKPNRHAPCAGPGCDRATAGGPAARRRRIRAAVLHLDAGLQSRALHHREPGSHRADPEHVDAAERRAARLDQGKRGRLDQRGSLRGADLHRATASQFLWLSERDGFMHLYLYAQDGTLVKQLTQGDWMIDSSAYNLLTPGRPVHVDPTGTWAYFTTTRSSPLERQIERVNLAAGELQQVSEQAGFHLSALSSDGSYLVDQYSAVDTPPITQIVKTDGSGAAVLAEAAGPALTLPQLSREFVTVKAHDGTDLYAQLVKPENFDPTLKYPVVVHWYGGPACRWCRTAMARPTSSTSSSATCSTRRKGSWCGGWTTGGPSAAGSLRDADLR